MLLQLLQVVEMTVANAICLHSRVQEQMQRILQPMTLTDQLKAKAHRCRTTNYDVNHGQFDIMIPGGGPGAFNGCSQMGISCAGAQYGGFLTECN